MTDLFVGRVSERDSSRKGIVIQLPTMAQNGLIIMRTAEIRSGGRFGATGTDPRPID